MTSKRFLFYLNYVGCKGRFAIAKLLQLQAFYLNYVGCKGHTIRLESSTMGVLSELCGM